MSNGQFSLEDARKVERPVGSTTGRSWQANRIINADGRSHESDVGRVVFDGLSRRLERLSRTQLYAARLGLQPHPYEPARLTDDTSDWKDRVQAIGNSVCVPVVRVFAEGIKDALDALYGL